MPLKATRFRNEIYLMLLEGSYVEEIARRKHVPQQNVQYQVSVLARAGVVRKKGKERTYPQFYEKGPSSGTFEEAAGRLNREDKDDATGVTTSQKKRSRTHAKGCMITLVTRAGELRAIETDKGELRLFDKPHNVQHGNEFFLCEICLDGKTSKVQFQRTEKGTMLFYVWPPSVMQSAGELAYEPEGWKDWNKRVLNVLSKYGDWRFGPSRPFSGETHFAVSEDAWFDQSKGTLESETTNLHKMWLWLNIDQVEEQLYAKIHDVEKYAEAVEEQSARKIGNVLQAVSTLADGQVQPKRDKNRDWHDDIYFR